MKIMRLPEMVQKVSSMVKNQSVTSYTSSSYNSITISTDIWDFEFLHFDKGGYYIYESVTIKDMDMDEMNTEIKNALMRQYICKYGVTICL
jgi:hypothetical protein|tara:strand:+ start:2942 stop:3214 length:273 start_codon:yes stop_codon:yes gene_type:complete